MLEIPSLVKSLLLDDSIKKNFRVHFPNGERADITNEKIVSESVKFTESLCSRDKLKFGLCESSVLEFTAIGVGNIENCTIDAQIEIDVSSVKDELKSKKTLTGYMDEDNYCSFWAFKPFSKRVVLDDEEKKTFVKQLLVTIEVDDVDDGISTAYMVFTRELPYEFDLPTKENGELYDSYRVKVGSGIGEIKNGTLEYSTGILYEERDDLDYPTYPIPYGRFIVDDCKRDSVEMDKRKIVAYSKLGKIDWDFDELTHHHFSNISYASEKKLSFGISNLRQLIAPKSALYNGLFPPLDFFMFFSNVDPYLIAVHESKYYGDYHIYVKYKMYPFYNYQNEEEHFPASEIEMLYSFDCSPNEEYKKVLSEIYEIIPNVERSILYPKFIDNTSDYQEVKDYKSHYATDYKIVDLPKQINTIPMVEPISVCVEAYKKPLTSSTYECVGVYGRIQGELVPFSSCVCVPEIIRIHKYPKDDEAQLVYEWTDETRPFEIGFAWSLLSSLDDYSFDIPMKNKPVSVVNFQGKKSKRTKNYVPDLKDIDLKSIFESLIELEGKYGSFTRDNGFELRSFSMGNGLFPSETLFPQDKWYGWDEILPLFPSESSLIIDRSMYSKLWFADALTKQYSAITSTIKVSDDEEIIVKSEIEKNLDAYGEYGELGELIYNPNDYQEYDVSDNYFFKNNKYTEEEAEEMLLKIAKQLKDVQYMPTEISMKGLPFIEAGDYIEILTKDGGVNTIVLRQTISGIQSLRTTIESK